MNKPSRSGNTSVALNVLLVVLLVGAGSWFFLKYRPERSDLGKRYADATKQLETYKKNPQAAAQAQQDAIITEVAKVYALPKDEKPTAVYTVDNDQAKLAALKKDQPFFVKAEAGDIVLIYSNAKLALLYRPTTAQLINVSSVTIQDQQTPAPTAP